MTDKTKELEKYKIRKKGEIEVLKCFLYKAIGGDMLSIHVYDTITKRVYAGILDVSSYRKEEIK